jgi:hypothetical protein
MNSKGLGNQSASQNLVNVPDNEADNQLNKTNGDNQIDAKTNLDILESRFIPADQTQTMDAGQKHIPLSAKLLLTFLIVGVLTFSFWSKIDLLNNFGFSVNLVPIESEIPIQHTVPKEPVKSGYANQYELEKIESAESLSRALDGVWADSTFFMIALHTLFSERWGVLAGGYMMNAKSTPLIPTAGIREGGNWVVGMGRFSTFATAEVVASSIGLTDGSYEIVSRKGLGLDEILSSFRLLKVDYGYMVTVETTEIKITVNSFTRLLESNQYSFGASDSKISIRSFYTKEEAYLLGWYLQQAGLIGEYKIVYAEF